MAPVLQMARQIERRDFDSIHSAEPICLPIPVFQALLLSHTDLPESLISI